MTMFCMPRTANRELVVSLAFDFLCLHREEHSVAAHLHDDDTSLCFRGGLLNLLLLPSASAVLRVVHAQSWFTDERYRLLGCPGALRLRRLAAFSCLSMLEARELPLAIPCSMS